MIGIDSLDKRILEIIGENPIHTSEISRRIGETRTTIQYRLDRLAKHKMASKKTVGRKSVWYQKFRKQHNKNYYRQYYGKDIINSYRQLFDLEKDANIFSIQGSMAAFSEFNILPASFIKEAHRVFKRKRITMRGMSNDKSLGTFDMLDREMIASHIDRQQGLKKFSGDIFNSAGEIFSAKNIFILVNPKSKFGIVVKDKGITKTIYDTLELLFELLGSDKTFDLNSYLKSKYS